MGQTKLKKYAGGITFIGRFPDKKTADQMVGEIEKVLEVDMGLERANGGIARTSETICDCDEADDCNRRVGCLFIPWEDEEDED